MVASPGAHSAGLVSKRVRKLAGSVEMGSIRTLIPKQFNLFKCAAGRNPKRHLYLAPGRNESGLWFLGRGENLAGAIFAELAREVVFHEHLLG